MKRKYKMHKSFPEPKKYLDPERLLDKQSNIAQILKPNQRNTIVHSPM